MKTMGRTIVIVVAVAVVYALIFGAQVVFGFGPASAGIQVPGGSPAWFSAVERWTTFDVFVMWPLLIVAGAVAQRLWCPAAPTISAVAVTIPALLAQQGRSLWMIAGVLYVAAALATAAVVDVTRARRRLSENQ